jgi:flagellar protein FliO/FliZ
MLFATPSGLGTTFDYGRTIFGFLAAVALLVLSFFVLRWLSTRTMGGSHHMRVIERLIISRDNALLIVQVGQRILAVSSAKDGVRLLCELSPRDIPDLSESKAPESLDEGSSLGKRFIHNMRVHMRLLPKGTPFARPPVKDGGSGVSPNASPSPSPFAMALLRAQSEHDHDGLMSLLNNSPDPVSDSDDTGGDSGSGVVRDYNAAIENLKQMGDFSSSREDKVDELFDKISRRSDRYNKKE